MIRGARNTKYIIRSLWQMFKVKYLGFVITNLFCLDFHKVTELGLLEPCQLYYVSQINFYQVICKFSMYNLQTPKQEDQVLDLSVQKDNQHTVET